MSILKVARMGHPVLRTKAAPVPPGDIKSARMQRLIDDLFDTMREYSGIGLAGPEVHESVRILVAGLRDAEGPLVELAEDDMPFIALVNPQVAFGGEEIDEGWEGCLSIRDVRGLVPRRHEIAVEALDRK